jgi:hypothetical protein
MGAFSSSLEWLDRLPPPSFPDARADEQCICATPKTAK